MALARIPSSDELYACGLIAGQTFVCRFMCGHRVYAVVPCDVCSLSPGTILEDVRVGVRITVTQLAAMAANGLITPVFCAVAFKAKAPELMRPAVRLP